MGKIKKEKTQKERLLEYEEGNLHSSTKKSVFAILLVGFAVVLFLAAFGKAGPVGSLTYKSFYNLFGIGYYLLPSVAILISLVFVTSERQKVIGVSIVSGGLLVLTAMGIIDLVLPGRAGLTGNIISLIEKP